MLLVLSTEQGKHPLMKDFWENFYLREKSLILYLLNKDFWALWVVLDIVTPSLETQRGHFKNFLSGSRFAVDSRQCWWLHTSALSASSDHRTPRTCNGAFSLPDLFFSAAMARFCFETWVSREISVWLRNHWNQIHDSKKPQIESLQSSWVFFNQLRCASAPSP